MAETGEPRGWAFLVARGRHRGYGSILAPDFLIKAGEYGRLAEVATEDAPLVAPRIKSMRTATGTHLTLAYQKHQVTRGDLDDESSVGSAEGKSNTAGEPATDEHGRRIQAVFGFITRDAEIKEVSKADLEEARSQALGAYRSFLADESGFKVQASTGFRLLSATDRGPHVANVVWEKRDGAARAQRAASLPNRDRGDPGRRRYDSERSWTVITLASIAIGLLVWFLWPRSDTAVVTARDFAFEPEILRTKASEVKVELRNTGEALHDFTIEGKEKEKVIAPKDETATGTFSLAKGTYTFYCSVADHRQRGMEGTLTVE